jgi:eukaryotic-like serine/threonine-protein kinase
MISNNYKVIGHLGGGSYGQVHLALNPSGAEVAVKVFQPNASVKAAIANGLISELELKKRFATEAKYQATINHPNVVKVLDSDLTIDPPYFVMERAAESLANDLAFDNSLSGKPESALFDVLAGLEAIHNQGIYHRDLKPQNVLRVTRDAEQRYAISDFGLMKAATSESTTLTGTGVQGGTERYAAPELMGNFKRATARSDIFSFGVFLLDIYVGNVHRIPYTEVQFAGAIGHVASKCTKKLAARRYASVAEVRSALFEAFQLEKPTFYSSKDEGALNHLRSEQGLDETQWDQVFLALEDAEPTGTPMAALLLAFTKTHLLQLQADAPDLLEAFGSYYTEYADRGKGRFDFSYCDVIADKLEWLFELGAVGTKARAIISLLILGASHNRWVVENKFMHLAGLTLEDAVAERIATEINVRGLTLCEHVSHVEKSINTSRSKLHPVLQALWTSP